MPELNDILSKLKEKEVITTTCTTTTKPFDGPRITIGIPTKNRYDALSHTLLSIAMQTLKPVEVIIVDDTPNAPNLTTVLIYEYVFKLLDEKGIKWKVIFGKGKGQHHSHQTIQEIAEGDWIYRVDDDEIMETDVLERLASLIEDDVAAIAPAVLMPSPSLLPPGLRNDITRMDLPNAQWYKWNGVQEADHLYSSFLYRKNIVRYELNLSNKAHREETIFSHSLKRAGYRLLVNGDARVWHWRQNTGGIRSDNVESDYHHDEGIFNSLLDSWDVKKSDSKLIVLDNGIGDHWAFKNILPEVRKKYGKLVIASCFPDVFWDEPDIQHLSIQDVKNMYGNIDAWQVYKLLWDTPTKMHLIDGFKKMYNV